MNHQDILPGFSDVSATKALSESDLTLSGNLASPDLR